MLMNLRFTRSAFGKLKTEWNKMQKGIAAVSDGSYTLWEFMLGCAAHVIKIFTSETPAFHVKAKLKRRKKAYLRNGMYVLKEARRHC
jgi:hypothetical protein